MLKIKKVFKGIVVFTLALAMVFSVSAQSFAAERNGLIENADMTQENEDLARELGITVEYLMAQAARGPIGGVFVCDSRDIYAAGSIVMVEPCGVIVSNADQTQEKEDLARELGITVEELMIQAARGPIGGAFVCDGRDIYAADSIVIVEPCGVIVSNADQTQEKEDLARELGITVEYLMAQAARRPNGGAFVDGEISEEDLREFEARNQRLRLYEANVPADETWQPITQAYEHYPDESCEYGNDVSVTINGVAQSFEVSPQIINDRTMLPLRAIGEALGMQVEFDETTNTAILTAPGMSITHIIRTSEISVNGAIQAFDVPSMIIDNRTLMPVRMLAEAIGANVQWDSIRRTAAIVTA